jgi:diketogulonate reductase-like aldo/keto reductase
VSLQAVRDIVTVARIKPAVLQVESHPDLPEWDLLDYCLEQGIVLQAFAALGHSLNPRVLGDPSITAAARHLSITPAHVVLSWAAQRGSAFLTTSTKPEHIRENFGIVPLPEDVMVAIRDRISTNVRFNAVVQTGVPGFIPRADEA